MYTYPERPKFVKKSSDLTTNLQQQIKEETGPLENPLPSAQSSMLAQKFGLADPTLQSKEAGWWTNPTENRRLILRQV